jgi:hypothetical protein
LEMSALISDCCSWGALLFINRPPRGSRTGHYIDVLLF